MTERLVYTPIKTGYAAEEMDSVGVVHIPLEGGGGRKKQDILLPGHIVNCQWLLKGTDFTTFMGFFVTTLRYGRDDFLLDLITDIGVPTTHRCRTIGGIPRLTQQKGDAYWVNCTLECDKNATFTSQITYTITDEEGPGLVIFTGIGRHFKTGDQLRILFSSGVHPDGNVPLNLDGTYVVDTSLIGNATRLDTPAAVNSDWTTLFNIDPIDFAEYGNADNGNVTSTVTKVPT